MDNTKILIVDDEIIMRESLAGWLERDGHEVAAAASGEEAMKILKDSHFDILLVDIKMEGISGLDVLKEVTADNLSIFGTSLQRGDAVALDGFSIGMDPAFVDDPEAFRPERWLPEAVAARKGKHNEVIDHPFELAGLHICQKIRRGPP